jgi:hypothetical protein
MSEHTHNHNHVPDAALETRVHNIEYMIRGNGEPGLNERVRLIERDLRTLRALAWAILIGVAALLGNKLWSVMESHRPPTTDNPPHLVQE